MFIFQIPTAQWGSEKRTLENRKHSKTGHFEGRFEPFEIRTFLSDFRMQNHLKTGPYDNRPTFDGHVWFSDPHPHLIENEYRTNKSAIQMSQLFRCLLFRFPLNLDFQKPTC